MLCLYSAKCSTDVWAPLMANQLNCKLYNCSIIHLVILTQWPFAQCQFITALAGGGGGLLATMLSVDHTPHLGNQLCANGYCVIITERIIL